MLMSDMTLMQTAILLASAIKRIALRAERDGIAAEWLESARPLALAWELYRWLRKDEGQPDEVRVISANAETTIGIALATRIRTAATEVPLYHTEGNDAPRLYWFWGKQLAVPEVTHHLRVRFESHPEEVDQFLDTYVGWAWGMDSGLARRSDFRRDDYNSVLELIDPQLIMTNLRTRYGSELDQASSHPPKDWSINRRIAHQFAAVHRAVRAEEQG
jgi:hypothetical protein